MEILPVVGIALLIAAVVTALVLGATARESGRNTDFTGRGRFG